MVGEDKYHLKEHLGRALAGDACAWNDFFFEIRKYLHAEVHQLLGPGEHGPVEESVIVQSTLRRIWERIGDQFGDGPEDATVRRFLGWIKTIVRNRTWEERRRWAHSPEVAGDAIQNLVDSRPCGRAAQRDRLAAMVAKALNGIPERDRQVVEMRWFDRLSDAAIGERLEISEAAVRVIRFRALGKLKSPELQTLWEESHDG